MAACTKTTDRKVCARHDVRDRSFDLGILVELSEDRRAHLLIALSLLHFIEDKRARHAIRRQRLDVIPVLRVVFDIVVDLRVDFRVLFELRLTWLFVRSGAVIGWVCLPLIMVLLLLVGV